MPGRSASAARAGPVLRKPQYLCKVDPLLYGLTISLARLTGAHVGVEVAVEK
jgi:hypothetical protein